VVTGLSPMLVGMESGSADVRRISLDSARAAAVERLEQLARRQAEALARRTDFLASEPRAEKLLEQTLKAIAEQLGGDAGTLCIYEAVATSAWCVEYASDGDRGASGISGGAVPPSVARQAEFQGAGDRHPSVLNDIDGDPRLSCALEYLRERHTRSLLVVPLWLEAKKLGYLFVSSNKVAAFHDGDLELANSLGREAVFCILLARTTEQARQSAVLEERNRIAREIHDTLAQGFVGVVAQLEAADGLLNDKPESARVHVKRAATLARESVSEARRSLQALRPQSATDGLGLTCALAQLITRHKKPDGPVLDYSVAGGARRLSQGVEDELLRIAQEALSNALRHADARAVRLVLSYEPQRVRLSVKDDGKGFSPSQETARRGFGILGMHERAGRIGHLTIVSEPGHGTEIIVVVSDHTREDLS
jgi:signal transduction histidine kinase